MLAVRVRHAADTDRPCADFPAEHLGRELGDELAPGRVVVFRALATKDQRDVDHLVAAVDVIPGQCRRTWGLIQLAWTNPLSMADCSSASLALTRSAKAVPPVAGVFASNRSQAGPGG